MNILNDPTAIKAEPSRTGTVTHIRFRHGGHEHIADGRDAWAIAQLIEAGPLGCTPIEHPGPRWSAYVHKWRKRGLPIETIRESHGGAYAGSHARYVLRSLTEILEVREAA